MTHPTYAAPPPPRRPRPRIVWFFVGGALIVLAPLVFAGALFTVLRPLTQEDAVFGAGGVTQVDLPAGEERALFANGSSPADCTATDDEAGTEVVLRPVTGELTYNEWTAIARFDTGSGHLSFDCGESTTSELRIAQLPSTGGFVAGIAVGVIVPILLFLAGVVTLIVVGIRYATGAPRAKA